VLYWGQTKTFTPCRAYPNITSVVDFIHFGICQVKGLGVNEDMMKTNLIDIHTSTQTLRSHSHANVNTIFVERYATTEELDAGIHILTLQEFQERFDGGFPHFTPRVAVHIHYEEVIWFETM